MIPNAIVFSQESQLKVDTYQNLPADEKKAALWSEQDHDPVRAEIKRHYIIEQNYRCAYCNQALNTTNNAVWDAEHIIPKSVKPEFMFEPRNLAVTCKDCNISKGEREVRASSNRVSFPDQSAHYIIVHPHFDTYDEHIEWMYPVCSPISSKGRKTIEICGLMRFSERQIGAGRWSDPRFRKIISMLNQSTTQGETDLLVEMLSKVVRDIRDG